MTAVIAQAASRTTTRAGHGSVAARVVGALLVTVVGLLTVIGMALFTARADGAAGPLFALPADQAEAALAELGWSSTAVLTLVVTVQAAMLVATLVAAAFILAAPTTTIYHVLLAVVLVLFVASATCAAPGWSAAAPDSAPALQVVTAAASMAFFALAPLFPTGTFLPRWSLAITGGWAAIATASIAVPWWTLGLAWVVPLSALAVALVVAIIVAQVQRYRRHSDRTQRQQTKWVLFALALYLIALLPIFVLPPGTVGALSGPAGVAFQLVRGVITGVLLGFIAVSISFAIAKYRLFDVDLVIRRTVVVVVLVILIAALYAGIVGGAALLWQGSGPVAAVGATVVAALVAHPLRMWLQRRATRWVYGERGDPYGVVSRLGEELRSLRGVEEIASHIAEVVVGDLRYSSAAVVVRRGGRFERIERGDAATRTIAELALQYDGEEIGTLTIGADAGDRLSAANHRLVASVASQAGLALGAAFAADAVRESRERLLVAQEEERRRLYRDLHDGLGPGLAGARQRIDTAMRVASTHPEASRRLLADASDAMADMLADVRGLVHGLRPPALDELGLAEAVLRAARPLDAEDAPSVRVGPAPVDLPPAVEVAAYRIAVEAVTNAVRHARAATVSVAFEASGGVLRVTVVDDGVGLGGAAPSTGRLSMAERAEDLGGRVTVRSPRAGGTRVRAELPYPQLGGSG